MKAPLSRSFRPRHRDDVKPAPPEPEQDLSTLRIRSRMTFEVRRERHAGLHRNTDDIVTSLSAPRRTLRARKARPATALEAEASLRTSAVDTRSHETRSQADTKVRETFFLNEVTKQLLHRRLYFSGNKITRARKSRTPKQPKTLGTFDGLPVT